MSTRVEVEEIQTTKSEKLLAWILAIFLLIAGVWTYQKLDDVSKRWVDKPVASASDTAAIKRAERAENNSASTRRLATRERGRAAFARETYRTELDAGRPAQALRARYLKVLASYTQAQTAAQAAAKEQQAAEPAAVAARQRVAAANGRYADRIELVAFLARAAFFGGALVGAYFLLGRLRRRGSRYFPVATAAVGTAALMIVVLAGDYVTDYVNPLDYGPLLLALFGAAVTLVAFWALQRYLARRVPHRRVRKHECPFCGYPVETNSRCEGCGREVVGACSACAQPRRVGTRFCGACGAA